MDTVWLPVVSSVPVKSDCWKRFVPEYPESECWDPSREMSNGAWVDLLEPNIQTDDPLKDNEAEAPDWVVWVYVPL